MKRLFICCDGTWNTATDVDDGVPTPTNVFKFYSALAESDAQGNAQEKYYHAGVGTSGGALSKVLGGVTGTGLSLNIKACYYWISQHYQVNDHLYLIGFSRGAYTARSLAGLIAYSGIPPKGSEWPTIEKAFQGYREKRRFFQAPIKQDFVRPEIDFVGVWDTVGSLGIPERVKVFATNFDQATAHRNEFHDTTLSPLVKNAFHAVAADELREDFQPTLWTSAPAPEQTLEQVYFPGVHADIGGGYQESELSNISLAWMIDKAQSCGAQFCPKLISQIKNEKNYQGILHDSYVGKFKLSRTLPRNLPNLSLPSALVHESVRSRMKDPPIYQAPYRKPHQQLGQRKLPVEVYARRRWNPTGIYLDKGCYQFKAQGQWLDGKAKCGPEGHKRYRLEALGLRTKRQAEFSWMELIGCITNGDLLTQSHSMGFKKLEDMHQHFPAWDHIVHVTSPGYLYFYANDAWSDYEDNSGSLIVTIETLPEESCHGGSHVATYGSRNSSTPPQ